MFERETPLKNETPLDEESLRRLEDTIQRAVSAAIQETFAAFRAGLAGSSIGDNQILQQQFDTQTGPLLHDIHRWGGSCHRAELNTLAEKYYPNPRAVKSLFEGDAPSIRSRGERRELTKRGVELALLWWESYGKPRAERPSMDSETPR